MGESAGCGSMHKRFAPRKEGGVRQGGRNRLRNIGVAPSHPWGVAEGGLALVGEERANEGPGLLPRRLGAVDPPAKVAPERFSFRPKTANPSGLQVRSASDERLRERNVR